MQQIKDYVVSKLLDWLGVEFSKAVLPVLASLVGWFAGLQWYWLALLTYLAANLSIRTVPWLIRKYGKRRRRGNAEVEADRKVADAIEHYPNRRALCARIEDEVEDSAKVCVLWFTGAGAWNANLHLSKKVERMLFIHPRMYEEPSLRAYITNIAKRSPEDVANEVQKFADAASASGVAVRWLGAVPKYLLVVSDYNTPHAWIRVERFDLGKDAKQWESFRVKAKSQPRVFDSLLWLYDLLWQQGEER